MLQSVIGLWSITVVVTILLFVTGFSRLRWSHKFTIYALFIGLYQALIAISKVKKFPFDGESSTIMLPIFLSFLICLYSGLCIMTFKTNRLSNSDIEDISDSPYVLGFCSTLAALIIIFIKFIFPDLGEGFLIDAIPTNEAPENSNGQSEQRRFELIAQSATALLTTFTGLIARMQLRGFSTKYQRYDLENEINKSLATTLKLLRRISKAHEQFANNIDRTQSAINSHQEAMKNISDNSDTAKDNYELIDTHSKEVTTQIKELDKNIVGILQKTKIHIKKQDEATAAWGKILLQNARLIHAQANDIIRKLKILSNSLGDRINNIFNGRHK